MISDHGSNSDNYDNEDDCSNHNHHLKAVNSCKNLTSMVNGAGGIGVGMGVGGMGAPMKTTMTRFSARTRRLIALMVMAGFLITTTSLFMDLLG